MQNMQEQCRSMLKHTKTMAIGFMIHLLSSTRELFRLPKDTKHDKVRYNAVTIIVVMIFIAIFWKYRIAIAIISCACGTIYLRGTFAVQARHCHSGITLKHSLYYLVKCIVKM